MNSEDTSHSTSVQKTANFGCSVRFLIPFWGDVQANLGKILKDYWRY